MRKIRGCSCDSDVRASSPETNIIKGLLVTICRPLIGRETHLAPCVTADPKQRGF